jgi:hypothetical protein
VVDLVAEVAAAAVEAVAPPDNQMIKRGRVLTFNIFHSLNSYVIRKKMKTFRICFNIQ